MNSTLKRVEHDREVTTIDENGREREQRSDGFASGTRSNNFSGADKPAKESDRGGHEAQRIVATIKRWRAREGGSVFGTFTRDLLALADWLKG